MPGERNSQKKRRARKVKIKPASGSLKSNEITEKIQLTYGNNSPLIEATAAVFKTMAKLEAISDFGNTEAFPILSNPETYRQDPDIVFFLARLKDEFFSISTAINAAPDDCIPEEIRKSFCNNLLNKLPEAEYSRLGHASQAFRCFVQSVITKSTTDEEKKLASLKEVNNRLSPIVENKTASVFKELLQQKMILKRCLEEKEQKANAFIETSELKLDILQRFLDKINYVTTNNTPIRTRVENDISWFSKTINNVKSYKALGITNPFSENDGFEHWLKDCDVQLEIARSHIKLIEDLNAKQPQINIPELDEFYRSKKNDILFQLGNDIIKQTITDFERSNNANKAEAIKELSRIDLDRVEKLKLVQLYCMQQNPPIISTFCKEVTNNSLSLTNVRRTILLYERIIRNHWALKERYQRLSTLLGKNNIKQNTLIHSALQKYRRAFSELDSNNAPLHNQLYHCLDLFKYLIEFHGLKKDIEILNTIQQNLNIPDEILDILNNFEKQLNQTSIQQEEIYNRLEPLQNFHAEQFSLFFQNQFERIRRMRAMLEKITNGKNCHPENMHIAMVTGSKRDLLRQLKNLEKNLNPYSSPSLSNRLSQCGIDLQNGINNIQSQYNNNTLKRLGRYYAFELRVKSPYYLESIKIIETINQEISRICARYIAAANRRENNIQLQSLIDQYQHLRFTKRLDKKNNPYRLLSTEISAEIPNLIDKRLSILLELRKKFSDLNRGYEKLLTKNSDYEKALANIAETTLEPDYLMQFSNGIKNWLVQFIRSKIIYPLKQLRHWIFCQQTSNEFRFFGTCMGASKTEKLIADQMLELDAVCRRGNWRPPAFASPTLIEMQI